METAIREVESWDTVASSAGELHRRLLESTGQALVAAATWVHEAQLDVIGLRAAVSRAAQGLEERRIEHRASLVGLLRALAHPDASEAAVDAAGRAADLTEALVTEAEQAAEEAERALEQIAGRARSRAALVPADELPDGDVLDSLPVVAARLDHHAAAVAAALEEASSWLHAPVPT